MTKTTPEQNKALVLEAFDSLFDKRDYEAAAPFWSENYIQHSAHIEPGRDGLFKLIRSAPETLRYEHQLIVAEGDYVIDHGRFTGNGRPSAAATPKRKPTEAAAASLRRTALQYSCRTAVLPRIAWAFQPPVGICRHAALPLAERLSSAEPI